ncbi:MAG: HPr(Ser) kinase/phosphatase [Burkholderiales bacterium]
MPKVTVAQLFEDNRAKLRLEWLAGRAGGARALDSQDIRDSTEGLIGHLNLLHPNWIQVLGRTELSHVATLDPVARQKLFTDLGGSDLVCVLVSGGETVPPPLIQWAETAQAALFASPLPSVELMWMLRPYLARALAESVTMHGVFLDVLGMGVLITGASGVGKSELGLELISRGSGLIADDVVELYRIAPETLEGRCPPMLRDFLEVRGLGILNVRTIFGEAALRPRKNLRLIVHLEKPAGPDASTLERLPLKPGSQTVMGESVRKVTIPVAAGRNLAVLVEAAVRNYVLQLRGIDSTQEIIARQADALQNPGEEL